MKNTIGLLILVSVFSISANSQNSSFIYMENEKFYEECRAFYPMIMNYSVLYEDSAGSLRITPPMDQCEKIQGCNSCGISKQDYRNKIVSHLNTIVDMGFNMVRIIGLAIRYDEQGNTEGNNHGNLISNSYYESEKPGSSNFHCRKYNKNGIPLTDTDDFKRQGDLIAQLFDIIREEKIPLRVMLLTGERGVELDYKTYSNYLEYLAERFSGEPILFAYDLYNEPQYQEKIDPYAFNKYDRALWFYSWYMAIKEKSPWHFVTYGPVLTDIFGWDPELMPSDFFSYHIYSAPREYCDWSYDSAFIAYKVNLKYASGNFTRPWILGETGLSGINSDLYGDYKIHPIVSTEEEQREFVENSLKYVNWYGIGGYAYWIFKDGIWSFKDLDTPIAKEYFMGIVHFRENNEWKPAAYEFEKFDMAQLCSDCFDPLPEEYYNPYFYKYSCTEGTIFARKGDKKSEVRYKDALILATVGKPGTKNFNHPFLTFSDKNGKFTIRSLYDEENMVVKQIRISAPGMSFYNKENWDNGLNMNSPIFLDQLDPASFPQILRPKDRKIMSRGKNILWDKKRVLIENNLVIKKGTKLTITDTLYVKPRAKIEVRNGGILEIKKGAIIGLCEWYGIDVWEGDKKERKKKKSGGQVILSNGASISNSVYGIRKVDSEGNVIEEGGKAQD